MPEIWSEPETFDPSRFTEEAQRNRHRFAWVPFSGGAHMCLGLHFRLHAGEMLRAAFPRQSRGPLPPGYKAGLADVADSEAARRIAGDGEAGVRS